MTKSMLRAAACALFFGGLLGTACGGPSASQAGCRYDGWEGQCVLRGVHTARLVERFPQTYVIVEALYEPQAKPGEFAPPRFRKQVLAPAEDEQALLAHVRSYPSVGCVVQNPVANACEPVLTTAVPEFVPKVVRVASVAEGCAKIESNGDSSSLPAKPISLPGPFQFDENAARETPELDELAADAAQAIKKDPRIECVAIRGMSAPGEPFALANDRAQTVRRLLEARGIDHTRVIVFDGVAPTHTATPGEQPVLSEHRRVHLSVVVYDSKEASK